MDKRPSSTKLRRQCVETNRYQCPHSKRWLMDCHLCGLPIDLALSTGANSQHAWEAEHVLRRVLSGDDGPENVKPAHVDCHAIKTRRDNHDNSKGKRTSDKHFGIERKRKKQWRPAGMKFNWAEGRYVREGADE